MAARLGFLRASESERDSRLVTPAIVKEAAELLGSAEQNGCYSE